MAIPLIAICLSGCHKLHSVDNTKAFPIPKIEFKPPHYIVYKAGEQLNIDGKLNEKAWKHVDWSSDYVNITGDSSMPPQKQTRAKFLWDKKYLYVGIQVEEPNIWATMKQRDMPLYRENACEIFFDPDGDTQHYLEFGINAFSTIYDLLLSKPYRDGGYPVSAYNILGLKAEVSIDGTINNPKDRDKKWTVEIAFPIKALQELNMLGRQAPPKPGDQWRVQLARAQRILDVSGGKYTLKKDPQTDKPFPSVYTSWAPQGLVNLHYPEMWGYLQFSGTIAGQGNDAFSWHQDEQVKWALRKVYYRQKQYYLNHHSFTSDLSRLGLDTLQQKGFDFSPYIFATPHTFLASSPSLDRQTDWFINQNGKIWSIKKE